MVVVGRQDEVAGCGEAARRRVGRGVGAAAVAALVAFPIAPRRKFSLLRTS